MTTHGLRGIVTIKLLERGHSDSSLNNCQNLEGALGERQQNDLLQFAGGCRKRVDGFVAEEKQASKKL